MSGSNGERVLLRQKAHWGFFVLPVGVAALTFGPLVVAAFLFNRILSMLPLPGSFGFLWLWLVIPSVILLLSLIALVAAFLSHEVTLTEERLRFRTGFLFRCSGEIPVQKIESLFLVEPLLGRLLGYGTVVVIGSGGTSFGLPYLPDAQLFHFELQRAVRCVPQTNSVEPVEAPSQANDDSRYMPKG